MNILLDRLHQKILNNDSLMKEVTEGEFLALAEAKEKQMPKKPIKIDTWGEYYKCPICDKYAVDNFGCKYKFCRECGQKFDWQTEI